MIFSSVKFRCARCRRRLKDGQIECEHCEWEVEPASAREMGRMVANFRRYYFWRRVKDIMLGKHSVLSQNTPSRRRSARFDRDRESTSNAASARITEPAHRTWLGMRLTTVFLLNVTACVMLAANFLDPSILPRIAMDDSTQRENVDSIQYGWPFAVSTTQRESIRPAAPGEMFLPELKRKWNYARAAMNLLVGVAILSLVRFMSERILLREDALSQRWRNS